MDEKRIHNAMLYLLADDHVCTTFGFNYCENTLAVFHLLCLYATVLARTGHAVRKLQIYLEDGELGEFLRQFCQLERDIARIKTTDECACVTWFLERWSTHESFPIPNRDEMPYRMRINAVADTMETFNLAFESDFPLNASQSDVFELYMAIQPAVWLGVDVYSSTWINFGFCYCKSFSQSVTLAKQYLALAFSAATFDDIVSAYETADLAGLMRRHGMDVAELESQGIRLHRPPGCEYSVYRLMIGVEHALSGRFCPCFRVREGRSCHGDFETHFDREADANFGFHLTGSWERWQLLNFYKHLFRLPAFDPRRMAEATEDPDRGSLERYLDALVPDMRRKVCGRPRGDIFFPRLGNRLGGMSPDGQRIPHFHIPCECRVHDVLGPPGISYSSSA